MLDNINSDSVLFLDIETVSQHNKYNDLPVNYKALWDHKAKQLSNNDTDTPEILYKRAGIYAEFGKIICISVGFLRNNTLRVKSFAGHDESVLLNDFAELLNRSFNKSSSLLCAHNGKEFDFPYIARRMLINGIKLPYILNIAGSKPWEIRHIDTMELWKFGDYKSYTSLALLTAAFGIQTPKDDIHGSQVRDVYYEENNLERIVTYCQKDVIAIVQLYRRYKGESFIDPLDIIIV